jgi:AraC-like DNA-binding protein/ligand-binding sensor protein
MKLNKGEETSLDKLGFLDEIREVFYQNTGMIISFFYPGKGEYDFYPRFERNEYCRLLQSTPAGLKKCLESDSDALEQARRNKDYCIYKCHAGLTNAVINLEYKGIEIGSIYTGQVLTGTPNEDEFRKIYETLSSIDLPYKQLRDAFFSSKRLDEDKLIIGVNLLNVMSNYIISVEDELYLQNELLRKDKEILEYKNEKMELENELQKLRISILEWDKNTKTGSGSPPDRNSHSIAVAREFIRKNYFKKIRLEDVAESVYLSPNYFSALFKKISGSSFSLYLRKIRMEEAGRLLEETDLPIKEIVSAVGLDDYNYFNRIFKQQKGIPPGIFRAAKRAGNHRIVE